METTEVAKGNGAEATAVDILIDGRCSRSNHRYLNLMTWRPRRLSLGRLIAVRSEGTREPAKPSNKQSDSRCRMNTTKSEESKTQSRDLERSQSRGVRRKRKMGDVREKV
jgi:hypothetical protein